MAINPRLPFAVALLVGLLLVPASLAKDKTKYETSVVADRNGTMEEHEYLTDGTSHVFRRFTNYISYKFKGEGKTIHLTVVCEEKWSWNHCFAMSAGGSYRAVFEFHNGDGDDFVNLTGHPGGNLTKPITTRNRLVNFSSD